MEPIEFPKNYQTYLKQGQAALAEKKLPEALELFEAAYQIKQEIPINWLLATTAFELGEIQKAVTYMKEKLPEYFKDPHKREFMLQALVVNQEFTLAEQTLWQLQKNQTIAPDWLATWQERIKNQADFYALEKRQQVTQIKTELLELKKHEPAEQVTLSRQIRRLPKPELLTVAKKLLVEPEVFPLVRSFLFEELAKLEVSEEVNVLTIDGTLQSLSPKKVGTPAEQTLRIAIEQTLKTRLENQDPVTLAALLDEVAVEFAALYPMPVPGDAAAWVASYLAEFGMASEASDPQVAALRQLVVKRLYL